MAMTLKVLICSLDRIDSPNNDDNASVMVNGRKGCDEHGRWISIDLGLDQYPCEEL